MAIFGSKNKNTEKVKELESYIALLKAHLGQLQEKKDTISEHLFVVTEFLLEEIIDMYESMKTLSDNEHFRSCLILARSILETTINIRYIYKEDTERRAANFRHFSTKQYLKRSEKMKYIPTELKELLERLKKKADDYNPSSSKQPNQWDGKNTWEKSKEIGLGGDYEIFSHLSTYIHGNFRGSRDLSIERPYNDNLRKMVYRDLVIFVTESLKVIAERFDLDGGFISMDYGDKVIYFYTNPKKAQKAMSSVDPRLVKILSHVPFAGFFLDLFYKNR